jgi:carbon storage regulator CsrA
MLILSRFPGQRVVVGEGPGAVVVTVAEVKPGRVLLGFDAPPDVRIDREEVRAAKNRAARTRPPHDPTDRRNGS